MIYNKEIKEKLPHGFGKIVAEKAGVNEVSVSRFLNGKTNSWKVERAALEVIAELQSTRTNISNLVKG
jgi:DNA-binding LacI/PurR family transcriptional regulator